MKQPLIIVLTLIGSAVFGQNLVPNPSFEEFSECPPSAGQLDLVEGWFTVNNSNPDFFNVCGLESFVGVPSNFMGHQFAYHGQSYANVCTYYQHTQPYREYIGIRLIEPLQEGVKYYFSIAVSLSDSSIYSTNKFEALLTSDSVYSSTFDVLPFTPQIELGNTFDGTNKVDWQVAEGSFVSNGGEKYLTLGNFYENSLSGVMELSDGGSPEDADHISAHYYIDMVCLSQDSTVCEQLMSATAISDMPSIELYPNPISHLLTIKHTRHIDNIAMYDEFGRLALQANGSRKNQIDISVEGLTAGIYTVVVIDDTGQRVTRRILKK